MLDLQRLFELYRIPCQGVVHVGAHSGYEYNSYVGMGFRTMLFIEAHPYIFSHLSARLAGTGMDCENYAISDRSGETVLHATNNGASCSILALKKHRDAHPEVVEVGTETVPTITLDELIAARYADKTYNVLVMDIQGAELLALKGAVRLLERIDAIIAEVNFDELYEGAPHIRTLDAFLFAFGFLRVDTVAGHRSWGDALYVRDGFTKV